ncbi:MAG: class I SAM-dependent methyltransferase [Candidatus Paceibacterota bacterium]
MDEKILKHKKVWESKKVLREVYFQWYKWIENDLSTVDGQTLEIGSGIGNYKEFKPEIISSDIHAQKWIDISVDAHKLPFKSFSLSNVVLCDTLHHLANPIVFLEEALRVLKEGGRIILVEPFPSPFSLFIYRKFHPEPFIMDADYFINKEIQSKDAWEANQAIPYLLFFKEAHKLHMKFSGSFNFIKRKKFSFLLYPATGGFENNQIVSDRLFPLLKSIEKILTPLNWLLAYRCYIVLQKNTM